MTGLTAVLTPFAASLLAFFWDLKLLVFFNSLAFFLFFYYFFDGVLIKKSFYLPEKYPAFFAAVLLSAFSAAGSPVKSLVGLEYSCFLASALLFLVFLNLEKVFFEKSVKTIYFIFAAMLFVALYQVYTAPWDEAVSTLRNANSFALFCLLAIGFSLENGSRRMALLFLGVLLLTRSAGAVVSLAAVFIFYRLEKTGASRLKKAAIGLLFLLALAAAFFCLLDHPSLQDRLALWKGAFAMFADRPFFGWGTGSFTFLYEAFHKPSGGFSSIYAHSYYLEFLAENGIFASALWFYFLYFLAFSSSGFYRYALLAALLHGFWDFGLSQPSNMWFFLLLAGVSLKNKTETAVKPVLTRFMPLLFLAGLLKWAFFCYGNLEVENALKKSFLKLAERREEEALTLLSEKSAKYPSSFDLRAVSSDILLNMASEKKDQKLLFRAARELEYLLMINPYYIPAYERLGKIYLLTGEKEILKELEKRKKVYVKWN